MEIPFKFAVVLLTSEIQDTATSHHGYLWAPWAGSATAPERSLLLSDSQNNICISRQLQNKQNFSTAQTENKQNPPNSQDHQRLSSPTEKILPVHTSHIVLLKYETEEETEQATRNWNLDTILSLIFLCVCGCPPGQSHQGRSFLCLCVSVGKMKWWCLMNSI